VFVPVFLLGVDIGEESNHDLGEDDRHYH
jgi:hypothetical protein